jgi:hypothetical protein
MTSSLADEIIKISELDPTKATERFSKLIESSSEQVKEDVVKAYEKWDLDRKKWFRDSRQVIEAFKFNRDNCINDNELDHKYENVIERIFDYNVQEENFEYFLLAVGLDDMACSIPKIFERRAGDEDVEAEDAEADADSNDYLSDLEED